MGLKQVMYQKIQSIPKELEEGQCSRPLKNQIYKNIKINTQIHHYKYTSRQLHKYKHTKTK